MNQAQGRSTRLPIGAIIGAIFGLGVGLLLGLVFAYVIAPVQFTDAEPHHLREDYAAFYWELVTQSYSEHGDLDLAQRQLGKWEDTERLQTILARARLESDPETGIAIDSLANKLGSGAATEPQATPQEGEGEATEGGVLGNLSWQTFLGVVLLLFLLLAVAGLLFVRARQRKAAASAEPRGTAGAAGGYWDATLPEEEELAAGASSLGHFVTGYALGDDHYDESFSIETPTGEFLGECGVGISETIGDGAPDHVTAFEVWLFDKNDIRTVTKVLMSEYAYNDEELRDRLAPKGEAVLAQPNVPLVLETATLRVTATATETLYGHDDSQLPPNSAFDRLTVELVAQQREDAAEAPEDEDEDEVDELDFGA
jgi:hypothetical protein